MFVSCARLFAFFLCFWILFVFLLFTLFLFWLCLFNILFISLGYVYVSVHVSFNECFFYRICRCFQLVCVMIVNIRGVPLWALSAAKQIIGARCCGTVQRWCCHLLCVSAFAAGSGVGTPSFAQASFVTTLMLRFRCWCIWAVINIYVLCCVLSADICRWTAGMLGDHSTCYPRPAFCGGPCDGVQACCCICLVNMLK